MNPTNVSSHIVTNVKSATPMKLLATFCCGSALLITGCQSTPTAPVMQRADSTFETTGLGKTKTEAQRNALDSANKTCRTRQPIILTDEVQYNGVFDQKTGRMIDQVGSIAGAVLGNKPDLSRDDDYEYTINFRCQ